MKPTGPRVLTTFVAGLCAAALLSCPHTAAAQAAVTLDVAAGDHPRRHTPVWFDLPAGLRDAAALRLVQLDDGAATPITVQRFPSIAAGEGATGTPPRAVWVIDELKPGATRRYRLTAAPRSARAPDAVVCNDDGKHLLFTAGDRSLLRYNYAVIQPPAGVDPIFARSGYIHPVWNPSGQVVTNDVPRGHLHHHGIWFPWTHTIFEGQETDFWNSKAAQGKVQFVKFDSFAGGAVVGHLRAWHQHIALKAKGGPKAALDEVWDVRVYNLPGVVVFDLDSTQTCASASPLVLEQYRYGGLGLRGSGQWEGDNVQFLTSEGRTRKDGHATTAKWCAMFGKVDGKPTGITVMCHPQNFRFPQNMRIHPSEPFFNYAPCQAGDFTIEPGKPYISKYRFLVFDGDVSAATSDRLWQDYAHPPTVRVVSP